MPATQGYLPWLSLLTATIELAGAGLALAPGASRETRLERWLVAGLLISLAGYQLLEVLVCGQPEQLLWSRLAFVDVVWLPPLGIHLMTRYRHRGRRAVPPWQRVVVGVGYAGALALSLWVLFDHSFVIGAVCAAVVATYRHGTPFHHIYGVYYQLGLGWLLIGGGVALVHEQSRFLRARLAELQLGVAGFVVPALLTQIIWRDLDPSLPSLMCHYALGLGVALSWSGYRLRASSEGVGRG